MKHSFIQFYRDLGTPTPIGASAPAATSTLPPSLKDLGMAGPGGVNAPNSGGAETLIKPGDGTAPAADLALETQKTIEEANKAGLNEDGTLKDGFEKNDKGQVVAKPLSPEQQAAADKAETDADLTEEQEVETFLADVSKFHGAEIPVEYPENVDPLSPEGVYHRDKAMMKVGIDSFDTHLRQTMPRAYAYLLHSQAGGSDEEFFSKKTISLPDYELFKADADTQIRVYKADLIARGLDPEVAQAQIDQAIKNNKLLEKADMVYKTSRKQQEDELAAIEGANSRAQQEFVRQQQALAATLTTHINDGKDMRFVIPDADKEAFTKFVREILEYDNERKSFVIVQPVAADKLPRDLESLYFRYKNGDLSKLVQRSAQTEVRRRLHKSVKKAEENVSSSVDTPAERKYVPLGSL